jgi:Major Facilitator Superfamily
MSNTGHIKLILLANSFHQSSLLVMVPVLQQIYGINLSVLGAVVGAGLLLSALSTPVWGNIAANKGYGPVLLASVAGGLLGITGIAASVMLTAAEIIPATAGLAMLIVARLLFGTTASAALPIAQALRSTTATQTSLLGSLGRLNALNGLGRIAGNGLIGPLLALGVAVPLLVVLPLYVAALRGVNRFRTTPLPPILHADLKLPVRSMVLPITVAFGVQCAIGSAYVLLGPLLRDRFDFTAEQAATAAGLCLMWATLAGIVTQLVLTRAFGRHTALARFCGLVMAGLGLWLLAGAATLLHVTIAACVLAIGVALSLSANLAVGLGSAAEPLRPKISTWLTSAQLSGLAAGSALAGVLGDFSIHFALQCAACLAALPAIACCATFLHASFTDNPDPQRNT